MADITVLKKYPHPSLQLVYWTKEDLVRIYINRKLGKMWRDFAIMHQKGDSWEFEVIARGPVEESTCRDLKVESVQEIPAKFFPEVFGK